MYLVFTLHTQRSSQVTFLIIEVQHVESRKYYKIVIKQSIIKGQVYFFKIPKRTPTSCTLQNYPSDLQFNNKHINNYL